MQRNHKSFGFSIVEVLIALALLSSSVAALYSVFLNTINAATKSTVRSIAHLHARSLLSELGVTRELKAGEYDGVTGDGYIWRLTISRREQNASPYAFYHVALCIEWPPFRSNNTLKVETGRIGPQRASQ